MWRTPVYKLHFAYGDGMKYIHWAAITGLQVKCWCILSFTCISVVSTDSWYDDKPRTISYKTHSMS